MNFGISIKKCTDRELGPEHIDFYKNNGIIHLEISIPDCDEAGVFFSEVLKSKILALSKDFTISCHALMWPNFVHPVKHTRREALRVLEGMLALCDEIGAMWLTIHLGAIIGLRRYVKHKLDRFVKELNALYDRRSFKTPVCIENMPVIRNQRLTGESFSELELVLWQMDSSRCGLLVDIGHYFLMHDSVIAEQKTLSRTLGVHIHNNDGLCDDHNYIYDGIHNPAQILKEVLAASPDAKLILENYKIDSGAVKKSLEYLGGILS